ncbi:hypothetical protein FRX31_014696 [Thalictrum thalictroides]|uniref:Uncharacterized protein n=1 Tax=Thalictrum thalictroides TaxID=46969 RepID=A0A7J6WFS5_THATH|nr:hypothetical protein FRX31_014696 [Thalictrum thalictroides]
MSNGIVKARGSALLELVPDTKKEILAFEFKLPSVWVDEFEAIDLLDCKFTTPRFRKNGFEHDGYK